MQLITEAMNSFGKVCAMVCISALLSRPQSSFLLPEVCSMYSCACTSTPARAMLWHTQVLQSSSAVQVPLSGLNSKCCR